MRRKKVLPDDKFSRPRVDEDDAFIMRPKIDMAFKLLFGTEQHKHLLVSLLKAILGNGVLNFDNLELLDKDLLRQHATDKLSVLDVRARTAGREEINIEIQVAPFASMPRRSLYYWSRLYTDQLSGSMEYRELKPCIVINLVDFICFPMNQVHSLFRLRDDATGHLMDNVLQIHFFELPKIDDLPTSMSLHDGNRPRAANGMEGIDLALRSELTDDEDETIIEPSSTSDADVSLWDWLNFIRAETREELELMARKNRTLAYAFHELKVAGMDEQTRRVYEAREKQLLDERSRISEALDQGREKGREEGREEGRRQERIELIRRLSAGGASIEQIISLLSLSWEEVEKALTASQ